MLYNPLKALFQSIQKKLDGIAMYRTVSLALGFLVLVSLTLGFTGVIPYTGTEQVMSLLLAILTAFLCNFIFSKARHISVNHESALITGLIVFFLIIPAQLDGFGDSLVIVAVTALAIVSKFTIVWRKQHVLNPAASGAVALAIFYLLFPGFGYFESSWWVGRVEFFIPLLLAGAAVVHKVRKWVPVLSFLGVAFVVFLVEEWQYSGQAFERASWFWFSGPSLFLAFFMLTEPFTMPPTKRWQAVYGVVVGFLSQTTIFSPFLKITPELALVLGNIALYATTLRRKLYLNLQSSRLVAKNTYEFVFSKPGRLQFAAGQYLEWMLPHDKADNRGIRRYFTIAAGPADTMLKIGVRFGENVSSYKKALQAMKPGDVIIASQLAGDFTLPKDINTKLAFVAGGIGVTPFISHLSDMQLSGRRFDTVLFYCNNTLDEIAYRDQLTAQSQLLPLKVIHVLAKENVPGLETGFLNAEMIKKHTPDYLERTWYLSGPPGMVNAYSTMLRVLGVKRKQIVKDFFPGLA